MTLTEGQKERIRELYVNMQDLNPKSVVVRKLAGDYHVTDDVIKVIVGLPVPVEGGRQAVLIRVYDSLLGPKDKRRIREVVCFYGIPRDTSFLELARKKQEGDYCGGFNSVDITDPEQAAYYPEMVADLLRNRPGAGLYVFTNTEGKRLYRRLAKDAPLP